MINTTPLKAIPIHRSLIRPIMLGGAERELVIINMTFVAALILGVGLTKLTIISAIFLLTVGQYILITLGKNDPLMSRIYSRHIHYKEFYLARGSRLAGSNIIHPSINIG